MGIVKRIYKRLRSLTYFLVTRLTIILALIALCQRYIIYPYRIQTNFGLDKEIGQSPGEGYKKTSIDNSESDSINEKLEVWSKYPINFDQNKNGKIALVFRGNGANIKYHTALSDWATENGYISYIYNYPGYGESSGSTNETAIYNSARSIVKFISAEHKVEAKDILIIGYSIGTVPAIYTAEFFQTKNLALFAPFTKTADVARKNLLFAIITFAIIDKLDSVERIKNLKTECLFVGLGKKDVVIPPEISYKLLSNLPKNLNKQIAINDEADHGNLLWYNLESINQYQKSCFSNN